MNRKNNKSQNYSNNDSVLLKINRQFSEVEAIKFLENEIKDHKNQIKDRDFRIGEMASEISELHDYVKEMKKSLGEKPKNWTEIFLEHEYIGELKKQNHGLMNKNTELIKNEKFWREKYFALKNSVQ